MTREMLVRQSTGNDMDLAEIKKRRAAHESINITLWIEMFDWLIAEVDRLTAENATLKRHWVEDDRDLNELIAENERLTAENTALREDAVAVAEANLRAEIADGGKPCHWCMEKSRAEGFREGVESALPAIDDAVKSYRSGVAKDEEGNGLELSDILAHGYGDPDIGRALGELDALSDHITATVHALIPKETDQ